MRPPVVKLLFSLKTWVIPSVFSRANGSLKREASVCLERTSVCLDLYPPSLDGGRVEPTGNEY
jgi:hypothetical protein